MTSTPKISKKSLKDNYSFRAIKNNPKDSTTSLIPEDLNNNNKNLLRNNLLHLTLNLTTTSQIMLKDFRNSMKTALKRSSREERCFLTKPAKEKLQNYT